MAEKRSIPPPNVPGFDDLVEIGRGGFAVVYRATQPAFARSVAIKVLTSPGLDDAALERFARECAAMGQLSWHPNVLHVYDQGTTDLGYPYLVAEFLEEGSLAARLAKRGPLPADDVVQYGVELASALQAAHDVGLLHRDVKPANVLLDRLGHAKLADFGIAAVTGSNLTASGMVTASLAHAAPEVMAGKKASPQSDLYSLASTLFTLLAGHPPFALEGDTDSVAMIVRAATEEPPDLELAGAPEQLSQVLRRAMAKDPAERYPSATAMADGLSGISPAAVAVIEDAPDPAVLAAEEPPTRIVAARPVSPTPATVDEDDVGDVTKSEVTAMRPSEPVSADQAATAVDVDDHTPSSGGGRRKFALIGPLVIAVLAMAATAIVIVVTSGDDGPTYAGFWYTRDSNDGTEMRLRLDGDGDPAADAAHYSVFWSDQRPSPCMESADAFPGATWHWFAQGSARTNVADDGLRLVLSPHCTFDGSSSAQDLGRVIASSSQGLHRDGDHLVMSTSSDDTAVCFSRDAPGPSSC